MANEFVAKNGLISQNNTTISGSLAISASSGIPLQIKGGTGTLFSISGSTSEIFKISDTFSSNLFTVSTGSITVFNIDNNKTVSISGSLVVTGSITGSITGSLLGTSSVATSVVGATPTEIGYLSGSSTNITNIDDWYVTKGFQAMGSAIKGTNLSIVSPSLINASTALSTGTLRMTTAYLPKPTTITGVKWYAQAIATSYTSTNYTGVGLYTSTAGTLQCVASCSNNPNMVSSSNFTAASWISQSFGSTYSAQPGLYYVGIVLGFSAATPTPTLSSNTLSSNISVNIFNVDFTNSNKFNGTLTGQTTMPNSIALSSLTAATSVNHGLWLY
jgi:hypothetical protein